jgi:hypothetical protein
MKHSSLGALLLATGIPLLMVGQAPRGSTPVVVTKFLGLFDQLRAAETAKTRGAAQHVAFRLNEGEINEYLKYSLKATPRPGLDSVTVKLFPNNYVSTFTIVDFDAVERWKPDTVPALLRPVLNGRKSVWVDYRFHAEDSQITFTVEKAYYQNIRLPAFFVQKMIAIVAARQPEKYDASKPLPIPFGLKRVQTAERVVEGET